jgi:ribosomal protein S6
LRKEPALYEAMYIVDAALDEAALEGIVTTLEQHVQAHGGELVATREFGRRRLAYEIDKHTTGTYMIMYFKSQGNVVDELTHEMHLIDGVVRGIVVVANPKAIFDPQPPVVEAPAEEAEAEAPAEEAEAEAPAEEAETEAAPTEEVEAEAPGEEAETEAAPAEEAETEAAPAEEAEAEAPAEEAATEAAPVEDAAPEAAEEAVAEPEAEAAPAEAAEEVEAAAEISEGEAAEAGETATKEA